MRYIQQTASELVIKNKPNVSQSISVVILSIFLMGIPLVMMLGLLYQIGVTTLKCKRVEPKQVNCEKQEFIFFGLVEQPAIKFSQVKSAKFKSKEEIDSEGNRTINNLVTLITSSGEATFVEDFVSINGVRGSALEMQGIATQINSFIQSNQSDLVIERDLGGDLYEIILPLGFLIILPEIIGVCLLFTHFRSQKIIFDKNSGQLSLEEKTLLGKNYDYYPLNEIEGICIQEKYYGKKGKFYELRLIPKKTIKLIPKNIHKAIRLSDKKLIYVKNIRATICDFLAIPLSKTFPYFFLRALFLEKLIAEENAKTLLFAIVYAVSIKRLPE